MLPVTSGGHDIELESAVAMVISRKAMTVNDNDAGDGAAAGSTNTHPFLLHLHFPDKIRWDLVVVLLLFLLQMLLCT
jgi:hypothetical protein